MSDKKLGYLVILVLLLFLFGTTTYLAWTTIAPVEIRTIIFPDVGMLNIEDPVRYKGVSVGSVRNISMGDNEVIVTIESAHPLKIYTGYHIEAAVKGLMGDRFILILPGDPTKPEIGNKDTLRGVFVLGPSEALAYMWKLRSVITRIRDISKNLRYGSGQQKSLIEQFLHITGKIDTLTTSLVMMSHDLDRALTGTTDSLAEFMKVAAMFSDSLTITVPQLVQNLDKTIGTIDTLIGKLDGMIKSAEVVADTLQNPDHIIWSDYIKQLQTDLVAIQDFMNDIETDGLKLPVKPK